MQDNKSWQKGNFMWFPSEINNEIDYTSWRIIKTVEFRGDICPSCDSENYSDEKCMDC